MTDTDRHTLKPLNWLDEQFKAAGISTARAVRTGLHHPQVGRYDLHRLIIQHAFTMPEPHALRDDETESDAYIETYGEPLAEALRQGATQAEVLARVFTALAPRVEHHEYLGRSHRSHLWVPR